MPWGQEHDKLLFRLARLLQEKGEEGGGLTINGSNGLQPQGLAHLATLFARGGQMTKDRLLAPSYQGQVTSSVLCVLCVGIFSS